MKIHRSYNLGSVGIRNLINKNPGILGKNISEEQIRSCSLEPTFGEEAYVIDADTSKSFRPMEGKTVLELVKDLPSRQARKVNIADGYEFKANHAYLIHLNEKSIPGKKGFAKNSQKSTFGRMFVESATWADYNPCFDEISGEYSGNKSVDLWLMVEPKAFDFIGYAGTSINQLKFFIGDDYKISDSELRNELSHTPILFEENKDLLIPTRHIIRDGLQVHIDLEGKLTDGIVGLRARKNPNPIDTRKPNGYYSVDEYFEILYSKNGTLELEPHKHYLLASKEILKFPKNLSAELKPTSHIGLDAILHMAGFIDQDFFGDLVFEIVPRSKNNATLSHGTPIGRMDMFRVSACDKSYANNSNYSNQVGPRPPKYMNWVYNRNS